MIHLQVCTYNNPFSEQLSVIFKPDRINLFSYFRLISAKFKKLNEAMTGLVSDYSLVNFLPLTINSKTRMLAVRNAIDKANGYCFTSVEEANTQRMMAFSSNDFEYAKTQEVRENFMGINGSSSEVDSEEDGNQVQEKRMKRSKKTRSEKLGNDLDKVDITAPGFQI